LILAGKFHAKAQRKQSEHYFFFAFFAPLREIFPLPPKHNNHIEELRHTWRSVRF